jgi:hypothetical protein
MIHYYISCHNVLGDLTDAKFPDKRKSKQFIEEWKVYQKTVNECKEAYDTTWLDIKGNHGKDYSIKM